MFLTEQGKAIMAEHRASLFIPIRFIYLIKVRVSALNERHDSTNQCRSAIRFRVAYRSLAVADGKAQQE